MAVHPVRAIEAYLEIAGLPPPSDDDLKKVREKLLGAQFAADPDIRLEMTAVSLKLQKATDKLAEFKPKRT